MIENERHSKHTFPEIYRGLAVRADKGDVVHALGLDFAYFLFSRHDLFLSGSSAFEAGVDLSQTTAKPLCHAARKPPLCDDPQGTADASVCGAPAR
ncbi:MAG: hypothetical protein ACJA1E_001512 [Paracoccaceae bacterium]